MPGPIFRGVVIFCLFAQLLWPRYFFVNVAGKGVSLFTFSSALMLFLAAFALYRFPTLQRRVSEGVRHSLLVIGTFTAFWIWRLVADSMGLTPMESITLTLLDFLYLGSWFLSCAVLFADGRLRRALPWVVCIAIVITAMFGLIEVQTKKPLSETLGFAGFSAGDKYLLKAINQGLKRGDVFRIRSVFSHPLIYGQFVASLTPFALALLVQKRWIGRILGAAGIAGAAIAVVLCNARSPMVLMVAGSAAFIGIYLIDFRQRTRLMLGLSAGAVLLFAVPVMTGSIFTMIQGRTSEEAISSSARAIQYEKGIHALETSPIVGYGTGHGVEIAGILSDNQQLSIDNHYLSRSVESGYVGTGLLCLFFLGMIGQSILLVYRFDRGEERTIDAACIGCAVSVMIALTIISAPDIMSLVYTTAGYFWAASGYASTTRRQTGFDWQAMLRGQQAQAAES